MSEVKLYYFDGRGKGECIRFMLAAAGIKFTEVLLAEREPFLKLISDGLLEFKQMPMLEIDGQHLVQTGAILRYIARKAGLYGKTDKESALIDMYYEGSRDFNDKFLPIGFKDKEQVLKDVKDATLTRFLPIYEQALKKNSTGYLVGSGLTMADVGLYEPISNTVEFIGMEALKDYPSLQRFYKEMTALPSIAGFLKSPLRKRPNDERYITEVKRVLNW